MLLWLPGGLNVFLLLSNSALTVEPQLPMRFELATCHRSCCVSIVWDWRCVVQRDNGTRAFASATSRSLASQVRSVKAMAGGDVGLRHR